MIIFSFLCKLKSYLIVICHSPSIIELMKLFYFAALVLTLLMLSGCDFPFPKEEKTTLPKGLDAHTEKLGTAFHKPGFKDPFSPVSGCSSGSCHQSNLKGGAAFIDGKDRIAPSCYQCHGEKWNED